MLYHHWIHEDEVTFHIIQNMLQSIIPNIISLV
ncbi:unnamed protein product, partial [Vitis vinifera]|uniref:Uncharacterized protein n=1 Tax=Vitis vinifera TaxID=29760 RepID=D7UAF2_VITVI